MWVKKKKCNCSPFQGIADKQAKNSSVKKLILLAAVPNVPETYFNVRSILDNLDIETVEFTAAADLKMCKFDHIITVLSFEVFF